MAFKAAEALAKALRESGPPVLKTRFTAAGGSEPRLQLAPDSRHQGDGDPHKEGRAVDIVLLASNPAERAEADELVALFRRMVDTIEWGWLIYNKKQWSPSGAEQPRIFRAQKPEDKNYAWEKARFEHVTHIHIEWQDNKKDLTDFYDTLVAELTSEEGDLLETLDAVPATLAGTWDVSIGDWKGVFKFTAGGGASWAESASAKPGNTGVWSVNSNRNLVWQYGNGDFRKFVTDIPLDISGTDGRILPDGQGFFRMSKRR